MSSFTVTAPSTKEEKEPEDRNRYVKDHLEKCFDSLISGPQSALTRSLANNLRERTKIFKGEGEKGKEWKDALEKFQSVLGETNGTDTDDKRATVRGAGSEGIHTKVKKVEKQISDDKSAIENKRSALGKVKTPVSQEKLNNGIRHLEKRVRDNVSMLSSASPHYEKLKQLVPINLDSESGKKAQKSGENYEVYAFDFIKDCLPESNTVKLKTNVKLKAKKGDNLHKEVDVIQVERTSDGVAHIRNLIEIKLKAVDSAEQWEKIQKMNSSCFDVDNNKNSYKIDAEAKAFPYFFFRYFDEYIDVPSQIVAQMRKKIAEFLDKETAINIPDDINLQIEGLDVLKKGTTERFASLMEDAFLFKDLEEKYRERNKSDRLVKIPRRGQQSSETVSEVAEGVGEMNIREKSL